MAFFCPVRIRRNKKKYDHTGNDLNLISNRPALQPMGRITGSVSIETLVRVGLEKEHGLSSDSRMIVLHDFQPCVDDELAVQRGQIINVLYQENDWVYVIAETETKEEGFIPASYCAPIGSTLGFKKKIPRDETNSIVDHNFNQIDVLNPSTDFDDRIDSNSKQIDVGDQAEIAIEDSMKRIANLVLDTPLKSINDPIATAAQSDRYLNDRFDQRIVVNRNNNSFPIVDDNFETLNPINDFDRFDVQKQSITRANYSPSNSNSIQMDSVSQQQHNSIMNLDLISDHNHHHQQFRQQNHQNFFQQQSSSTQQQRQKQTARSVCLGPLSMGSAGSAITKSSNLSSNNNGALSLPPISINYNDYNHHHHHRHHQNLHHLNESQLRSIYRGLRNDFDYNHNKTNRNQIGMMEQHHHHPTSSYRTQENFQHQTWNKNGALNEKNLPNDCRPFRKDIKGRYLMLFTFKARDENDISVERGEIITVLNDDDPEWYWIIRSDSQEGFVPVSYTYPADLLLKNHQVP
ncbi:hypothetical protein SSS_02646 [Sarcoptes scabiei]|uniref:SH3 domain-containing protein n=1 Tax=Sarcoptes scabiei TaxID=52283 RepID=A0A834RGZ3_SARSC|nr:hypothetical protein SSS_02646 [Sarcoptes scabiei]